MLIIHRLGHAVPLALDVAQSGRMPRIALLTQLPSLIDQCAALADGIGVNLAVASPMTGGWQDAALVLLGEDVSDPPGGISAPTVLIAVEDSSTVSRTSADAFGAAARLGADHVAILPAAAEWLVQRMIAAVEPPVVPATTVGIIPGCGGAGATMLAAALAVEGQRAGLRTVLVDGDPLGGGIDLVLGAETTEGLRWPALAASKGSLRPSTLVDALPRVDGLAVLSWDRTDAADTSGHVFDTVLGAAQQAFDFVVVDLPRHAAGGVVRACHHVQLVVPARVRAAVGGAQVAGRLRAGHHRVGLIVREDERGGIPAQQVADAVGLPLTARMRAERGLAGRIDRGESLPTRKSSLTATAAALVEEWFPAHEAPETWSGQAAVGAGLAERMAAGLR